MASIAHQGPFRWKAVELLKLFIYIGLMIIGFLSLPNNIWDAERGQWILVMAYLGIWRYVWWTTHFTRAVVFSKSVFPQLRERSDQLWKAGWRPQELVFMLTTFYEERTVTERVILSIIREVERVGVPARIFVGSGTDYDEKIIEQSVNRFGKNANIEVFFIRQNQPGKRMAIGLTLRAISRRKVHRDTPIIFIDGDTILSPQCLDRCLPMFRLNPKLHAMTTDEQPILYAPKWVRRWFALRFAQRHMVMQSHSLSKKVLTLTGRMSIFRAAKVLEPDFVRLIEADCLDHWLWGRFRFLSGDDKSTWYALLLQGAEMLYVPDATVWTVDTIQENVNERMKQNLLRWSGNMLRNGARAIALGPRRVGWFIWWCIVDQRIAMWTSLAAPLAMISAGFIVDAKYWTSYILWVLLTRLFLSCLIWYHDRRLEMSYPFMLYLNQMANAAVKVYLLFRLPNQRWANRQDQRYTPAEGIRWALKNAFAFYLTIFYVMTFMFIILIYIGVLRPPEFGTVMGILGFTPT